MRHVIIGNSAAGVAAAETLRKLDEDAVITVISEDQVSYSRSLTPYFLSGRLTEDQMRFRPATFYDGLAVETRQGRAISIDAPDARVALSDGSAVSFDRLLIATGASPIKPAIPGIDHSGVFLLRTAADARAIAETATKGARAAVIGGGLVGLLSAKALCELGLSVTIVEAMPHLLPQQLDPAAAQIVAAKFKEQGIDLVLGRQVREVVGEAEHVAAVQLSDGERITAKLVVVGVGVRPNLSLAQASGIRTGRGISVNSRLQTSEPNVYAAGDVAEVLDLLTGQPIISATWIAASEQGKIAAYNMAGIAREYEGALGVQNAADFFGLPVVSVGLVDPRDDAHEILLLRQPARQLYKKLVLEDDVIKGMICVGDIGRAGVITALIRSKSRVTEFKDELLSASFNGVPVGAGLVSSDQSPQGSYV